MFRAACKVPRARLANPGLANKCLFASVQHYTMSAMESTTTGGDSPAGSATKNATSGSSVYQSLMHNLKTRQYDQSQGDQIANPFARASLAGHGKEVVHLTSLLETCIAVGKFERAENILNALYPLCQSGVHDHTFITNVNGYLAAWAARDGVALADVRAWISAIPARFAGALPNDRTVAILVTKAMDEGVDAVECLSEWCQKLIITSRAVLRHVDVIGLAHMKTLAAHPAMRADEIPREYQHLMDADARTEPAELATPFDPEHKGASVEKDTAELRAVSSFGLKVVRHALLGIEQNKEHHETFFKNLEETFGVVLPATRSEIDFHAIYRSLPVDQKPLFDTMLEEFNHERQRNLENRAHESAVEKWRNTYTTAERSGTLVANRDLNVHLWNWYRALLPLLEQEIARCKVIFEDTEKRKMVKGDGDRKAYAPYLLVIDLKKMAVTAILELLKLNSTGGVHDGMRTARAVIACGKAIEMEYRAEKVLRLENSFFRDYKKQPKSPEFRKLLNSTKAVFRNETLEQEMGEWPSDIKAKVGSVLVSLIMHVARIPVEGRDPVSGDIVRGDAPAFYHTYQYQQGTKIGVLKVHKSLIKLLSKDSKQVETVAPQTLPMLTKPRPWTGFKSGGFHYSNSLVLRTRDSPETLAYLEAASENGSLASVYKGLTVLGDTPWTVNRKIYDIVSQVWNTGESFLDIAGVQDELELPPPPPRDADPVVRRDWSRRVKALADEFSTRRSERCDSNYKLEIARGLLGEKIYFPHNIDFRGRAYPLSAHFNHLGNDMTRSLLVFWEGKPLGAQGLRWLKIHLANTFGHDKIPFDARVAFADAHVAEIMESARDPLHGAGWWKSADKPWQALSTIFELSEALQMADPTQYVSHQPVHQDGTCNGLQHYAALGGDPEGAKQVNLSPLEKPQDVYAFVAELVKKRLAASDDPMAAKIIPILKRKIVKQTVMTNVYGVTYIGGAEQIKKQLDAHFDDKEAYALSRFLATHTFAAIRELFNGAHLIQDWLGECARAICKAIKLDHAQKPDHMSAVIWTSPLGLPCVQPYRNDKKSQISTNLQTVFISDPYVARPVDPRRQQAGFPPNFIHSIDASHMLMSAIRCRADNLAFASVHDSFWTHAADVDIMNEHIRSGFVSLHGTNLVARLKREFDTRYKGFVQMEKVLRNHPIVKQITDLRKTTAKQLGRPMTTLDEIYLEQKRRQLLASLDPQEVQAGREMVTTVSLAELIEDIPQFLKEMKDGSGVNVLLPFALPEVPEKGEFDVNVVKESPYFFS
ncbi:hypothetical protein BABINDRAFT_161986 [Babjeviella inositovora NRRL Y-12698]|uniref:DNA-directed RNA polymerase n=1 Tax=Babjeviella inositovora NRRL Y-12698 TaxID=984486 RepID=A0A1E3QPI7_9ASCO|nr:uncharacterized protein BABINDRAFT_161986 [Babjeviella inositovora NRRL Y-12698]ODQ79605.1 hypothetical protein BABINDRAFT_161986 [Babjeviella inositovora NRRL Y-12698]